MDLAGGVLRLGLGMYCSGGLSLLSCFPGRRPRLRSNSRRPRTLSCVYAAA
jgi:hypothetical protein